MKVKNEITEKERKREKKGTRQNCIEDNEGVVMCR